MGKGIPGTFLNWSGLADSGRICVFGCFKGSEVWGRKLPLFQNCIAFKINNTFPFPPNPDSSFAYRWRAVESCWLFYNSTGCSITQMAPMCGINCSWQVNPTPWKRESGTVGFPSLWEILHTTVWGIDHLNTPDRWKGNRSGKAIDPKKLRGSLKFWGHKMVSGWELAKLWGGHCC